MVSQSTIQFKHEGNESPRKATVTFPLKLTSYSRAITDVMSRCVTFQRYFCAQSLVMHGLEAYCISELMIDFEETDISTWLTVVKTLILRIQFFEYLGSNSHGQGTHVIEFTVRRINM